MKLGEEVKTTSYSKLIIGIAVFVVILAILFIPMIPFQKPIT